jgi:hypothetical protein
VFVAAFALGLGALLLPEELEHYRQLLCLPPDVPLRLAVCAALLGKTLAALAFAATPAAALIWWGRLGWARVAGVLGPLAVGLFLLVDLEVHRVTGNHVWVYGTYLNDADALHWAGQGFEASTPVRATAGLAAAVAAGALLIAMLAARWPRHAAPALAILWLLGLAGAPLLQRFSASHRMLVLLDEELPWSWHAGLDLDERSPLGFQRRVQTLYAAHRERLHAPWNLGALALAAPASTPDVVVVVLESLRNDALEPEVMPHLSSLAERGLHAARHLAGSNSSHYGFYSLLYGRSPLEYYAAERRNAPPTLVFALRAAGYQPYFLTSGDTHWEGMERFLGAPHFETKTFLEGPNWQRDRDLIAHARELMAVPSERPRLLLVFLMSTHWGFDFPPGAERFRPSVPPPNGLDYGLITQREALVNRYRNAAHYLDGLLGPWLAELDLERTVVVVTGDHGESLFDDGTLAHSSRLSEIQTHVPLVMAGVGVPEGRTVRRATTNADLLPTVLSRLGYPAPTLASLPGRDLATPTAEPPCAPLILTKAEPGPREEIAFVTPDARLSGRLLRDRGRALFLGRLRDDGLPVNAEWSLADGERFLECFADWLEREGRGAPAWVAGQAP